MQLVPDASFEEAPQLDVLLVPGGYGQEEAAADEEVLTFIREQSKRALYVYSVCTGALICGAAGLLHGQKATTHWTALDVLPAFDVTPVCERVVIDRNRITAGGDTAWLDFGLMIAGLLHGE